MKDNATVLCLHPGKPRYGVVYVGVTNKLVRRTFYYQQKLSERFTKAYGVNHLVYFEEYLSALQAWARERALKRTTAWKLKLIGQFNPSWRDFAQYPAA